METSMSYNYEVFFAINVLTAAVFQIIVSSLVFFIVNRILSLLLRPDFIYYGSLFFVFKLWHAVFNNCCYVLSWSTVFPAGSTDSCVVCNII